MKHKAMVVMKKLKSSPGLFLLIFIFLWPVIPGFSQSGMQISATSLLPGRAAAYKFSFTTEMEVSVSTDMHILFPPDYDIGGLVLATCNEWDGRLSVSVDKNIVHIKRAGAQNDVPAGTVCNMIVASVTNPPNILHPQRFEVSMLTENKIVYRKTVDSQIDQIPSDKK